MKALKVKVNSPAAVEKSDGVFLLKADNRQTADTAVLAKGGLKVDDLAGVVSRLMERVKRLEEG